MNKDAGIFLDHILECIARIEEYTANITSAEFFKSSQLQDAVIRRIEIIGEAAKNVPDEFKNKWPDIPWKQMAGMRDILVHEYFGVDLDLTWQVVKEDLSKLKENILKVK